MIQKKKSLAFCAAIVAGGAFLLGSGFASAQTTVVNTGTATSTITGTIDISGLDKQKMLTQIQAAISNIQQTLTTILINYAAIQQQQNQNLINSATQQITGSGSATSNPLGGLLSGGTGSGIGSFVTGSGNATTNVTGNAYTNVNGTLTENSGTVSGDTSPGQSTITNSGTISGSTPINTTAIQQQISTIQNQIMSIFSQIGGGSTASTGN
jgi:hypothetical protein